MVGDKPQHALSCPFDAPLREANELHVVVIEPLWVSFAERLPIDMEIARRRSFDAAAQQIADPLALVGRVPRIRRVADHDHDRMIALDGVGLARLLRDFGREHGDCGLLVRLFERVGEENIEPPAVRHHEPSRVVSNLDRELQVGNRVWSHQQLESEQARQQVLVHVVAPAAAQAALLEIAVNYGNNFAQKRAGARRRIENQHPRHLLRLAVLRLDLDRRRVGEAVRKPELVAQQPVDAAHDVGDDRLRRVVDAVLDLQLAVVGREKVLVEVHRGVFLPGALAEIFKDRGHVRSRQQPRQIVDDPGDPSISRRPRHAPEYIAQKGRGLGERGRLAREGLRRALVKPARREQAVGDRLRL